MVCPAGTFRIPGNKQEPRYWRAHLGFVWPQASCSSLRNRELSTAGGLGSTSLEQGCLGKRFPNPRVVTQSPPAPGLWESPGWALPYFYGSREAGPCLLWLPFTCSAAFSCWQAKKSGSVLFFLRCGPSPQKQVGLVSGQVKVKIPFQT